MEKFTSGNKVKHFWVMSTNFFFQKLVDNAQQCFAFTPQANFPIHNLNFHWSWRWWDWIQATFQNLFYFIQNCDDFFLKVTGFKRNFDVFWNGEMPLGLQKFGPFLPQNRSHASLEHNHHQTSWWSLRVKE